MAPEVSRRMHRTLEPFHGMVYFAAEAQAEYEALGVDAGDHLTGYFASRAAPMGAAPADVVVATFYNFHPALVGRAVPACWDVASPEQWTAARRRGADRALARLTEGHEDPDALAEALGLACTALAACDPAGRPLFAGHRSLDWPGNPRLDLWHALTLLREHRGDGHVSVLVAAEVSPLEALVLHEASGMVPPGFLQASRSWSDAEWEAGRDRLRERGWVHGDELTTEGRDVREQIEQRTDALALAPWRALGEDGCARLRELVRPMSRAIVGNGGFAGVRPG